jgi:hypothetical protein
MSNDYLADLTDDLINKGNYDKFRHMSNQRLEEHIFSNLAFGTWVERLSTEKLAIIICSFDIVQTPNKDKLHEVMNGFLDGRNLLERAVSACLASYIVKRLRHTEQPGFPSYVRGRRQRTA